MHRFRAAALAALAAALVTGCTAPSPTRLQLKAGDTRTGVVETTSEFPIRMGIESKFAITETVRLKMTVDEVPSPEGPIAVSAVIDDYKIDIAMNGQSIMAMPMFRPIFEEALGAVSAVKGKDFAFKVSPRGEVLEVTGAEDILEAFKTSADLPMEGLGAAGALSAEQLQRHCSMLFAPLPLEPIAEGAAWKSNQAASGALKAEIAYDWTLKAQNDAFITFAAAATLNGTPPGAGEGEGLTGAGEATREIERATGWVVDGKETFNINGKIRLNDNFRPPGMPAQMGALDLNGTITIASKTY